MPTRLPDRAPTATAFDALAAPADSGAVLVFPPLSELPGLIERNRTLRRAARVMLLGDAISPADVSVAPVVLSGHQPAFFHAGIWIKNVAAARLATAVGGTAGFLAVDSDAADESDLRWPADTGGLLRVASTRLPGRGEGVAFEQLPRLSASAWRGYFSDAQVAAGGDVSPAWDAFVAGFCRSDGPADCVSRWYDGVCGVDARVGVETPTLLRVSALGGDATGATWWRFVAHCVANAAELATAYNAALAAYRSARGIRGSRHPMPDLAIGGDRVELPFWVLSNGRGRARLFAESLPTGAVQLATPDSILGNVGLDALARDPAAALREATQSRAIRPRALLLTAFARLFCCDLFIHGLGGARYDQITDDLLRRFVRVEPPGYACVTATLRLSLPRFGVSERDLAATVRMARDLRYNPERFLNPLSAVGELATLLRRRSSAIERGDQLRRTDRWGRVARRAAFDEIRKLTAEIARHVEVAPPSPEEIARLAQQAAHDRIADSRDWFFSLHPVERLQALAGEIRLK